MSSERKFKEGDMVKKKGDRGQWHGCVCGYYSSSCTKVGYAVESLLENGSVQIYPENALEIWKGPATFLLPWGKIVDSVWRPIETAPKDKTKIVLFLSNGTVREGFFGTYLDRKGELIETWCFETSAYLKPDPTHWMPLPKLRREDA